MNLFRIFDKYFSLMLECDVKTNELVLLFNDRDPEAFCELYRMLYKEFIYFTSKYLSTPELNPNDVVHDVLIHIWQHEKNNFESIEHIKAYVMASLRNKCKDILLRSKSINQYRQSMLSDDYAVSAIVETETFSIIDHALDILPEECAKVFKLHLDGWNVNDIAEKLNKSKSTVYAQRNEAISLLKRKLPGDKFILILLKIGSI